MQVSAKLIDNANAIANIKASSDEIKAKVNQLAQKAAKNMKIDGFRAGKVPVAVVLKRYEKELKADAEQDILKEAVDESIKQLKRDIKELIGEPTLDNFNNEDGLSTDINISFKPTLSVEGYEEIIPDFSTPRVLKKEIDEKKEEFLKMVAPIEKSDKTELAKGDFAKFDFEGFIDDVPFDGGKANDYVLEIGSNQFIPGFEDAMVGLKVGEEKDVNVTFPTEYGAPHLAGKPAVFKVKLNEIQERKIPSKLDDELLKRIMPNEENPSEEKLDEQIKEQLKTEKMYKLVTEELKPKFAEALVEKFNFDIPKNIVEQEIDMQFRNAWQSFSEEDMKKFREDKDALTNKREEYRKDAENSVKLTFIIDELAKAREIKVDDQEVLQAIYFEAYRAGLDPKEHLKMYQQQGMLPAVKMSIIEEKLFQNIFSKDDKKKAEKSTKQDKADK